MNILILFILLLTIMYITSNSGLAASARPRLDLAYVYILYLMLTSKVLGRTKLKINKTQTKDMFYNNIS